jgi:hypothetical protein
MCLSHRKHAYACPVPRCLRRLQDAASMTFPAHVPAFHTDTRPTAFAIRLLLHHTYCLFTASAGELLLLLLLLLLLRAGSPCCSSSVAVHCVPFLFGNKHRPVHF